MAKKYWLMKSEPDVFSIWDLKKRQTTLWDGVRNYQARNYMTEQMQVGDEVIFYHSNAKPSGCAGLALVSAPARPDASALDKKSEYYDPKSTFENPRWFGVEVKYVSTFPKMISLEEIKLNPLLKNMVLVNNSRLSVQPVSEKEFHLICSFHKENKYHEPEKSL